MKSDLLTIIKKECARFFGDKKMLFTMLSPGILIYVMYSFMGNGFAEMYQTDEDFVAQVAVVNMPETFLFMEEMEGISLSFVEEAHISDIKAEIQEDSAHLLMVFPEDFDEQFVTYDIAASQEPAPNIEIYYNSANTESGTAYKMITAVLDGVEESVANKFDICAGEGDYDLASEEDVSAMIISMIMPMLIVMLLYNGCMAVAIESIVGEKERGTIATLLVTPMKRSDLALGKIISISLFSILSAISSFLGIMLSLPKLLGSSAGMEEMTLGYTAGDYGLLFMVILTTTLVFVGAISILSALAKSVKEASSMTTPLMLLVTLTGLTNMMSNGMPEEWFWYLIPVYNTVQCINGIFSMDYTMLPILITAVSNILYTGGFVVILTKMFNSERIMYN